MILHKKKWPILIIGAFYFTYIRLIEPLHINMVRVTGVEPACLAALDPKSSASANFATPAYACLL